MTNKDNREQKLEKAIEWLENASYNIDNLKRGLPVHDMVKNQIDNAIKYLRDEDVEDGVMGKLEEETP